MICRIRQGVKDPAKLFGVAMVVFVIICYNVLILHNGYRFLNSDDASELVLARILASENSILTKDWIYASELRVFNTNLVFAPMFYMFSSWKLVRAVGGTIMMLIYVLSYMAIPYAWRYDPKLLTRGGATVDKLSLYLSLKNHPDPRVQGELNPMLEDFQW